MGGRIKKRRETLNIQTNDLAKQIEVTPSLISQIERAKAFPSILTLKKIADALHTTVGELIGEKANLIENPHLKLANRKFVKENKTGTKSYLLSHHDTQKQMDPFLLLFNKGADSSGIMTPKNPRQEFCLVLKGQFEVHLSSNVYKLKEGDSFYFISNQEHLFKNANSDESELLWVVNQSKSF
jgi:transcriptional regulator with XRE-family HTH domain